MNAENWVVGVQRKRIAGATGEMIAGTPETAGKTTKEAMIETAVMIVTVNAIETINLLRVVVSQSSAQQHPLLSNDQWMSRNVWRRNWLNG